MYTSIVTSKAEQSSLVALGFTVSVVEEDQADGDRSNLTLRYLVVEGLKHSGPG
jgi:hypothetical protein